MNSQWLFYLLLLSAAAKFQCLRSPERVDTAHDALIGRDLDLSHQVLYKLLFDSIEDYGGNVRSRVVWNSLLDDWHDGEDVIKNIETMFMEWDTPAKALEELPPRLRTTLETTTRVACKAFCRWSNASSNCCDPATRCPQIHKLLKKIGKDATFKYVTHYERYQARFQEVSDSLWPFGLPALFPPFLSAMRIVDGIVKLVALLWSRYASNPTLRQCLASEWGDRLKDHHLGMVVMWQELRRVQEIIYWELIATSRYGDVRWGQAGLQTAALLDCFQRGSNIMRHFTRVLDFFDKHSKSIGWSELLSYTPGSQSLAAASSGEYPSLILARGVFQNSFLLDKPLLRFLLRNVFQIGQTIGEFGAFGGHYSTWLNDTGLVEAFAFDGIPNVEHITKGRVKELNLAESVTLPSRFDWILCLEVGEHLPKTAEETVMQNIKRHARVGAVISWATPDYPSPYHPNTLTIEESTRLIERHGFRQDKPLTNLLREAAETSWLKQTAGVYYKQEQSDGKSQPPTILAFKS